VKRNNGVLRRMRACKHLFNVWKKMHVYCGSNYNEHWGVGGAPSVSFSFLF
jgi:hypothetical protein